MTVRSSSTCDATIDIQNFRWCVGRHTFRDLLYFIFKKEEPLASFDGNPSSGPVRESELSVEQKPHA